MKKGSSSSIIKVSLSRSRYFNSVADEIPIVVAVEEILRRLPVFIERYFNSLLYASIFSIFAISRISLFIYESAML